MQDYIKKLSENLNFINETVEGNNLIINVASTEKECRCPNCGKLSKSVQAKYLKKFQDLPINGKTVYIKIYNRVFNCTNTKCDLDMFAEQYSFVEFKQNKTKRLVKHILDVSNECSTREAEKKLRDEGILIGKSTIALLITKYKSK